MIFGCSSQSLDDYANSSPKFDVENYFKGQLQAQGIVMDRGGKVTRRFTVEMLGTWKDGQGKLEEWFIFDDGEKTTRTWQFYIIWIIFAFGSGAGLMIIGNLASIVKDQIGLPAFSAIAVSALALGNGGGRVLYGILSDKIGRRNTLLIAFIMQAFLIGGLFFTKTSTVLTNVPVLMVFVALVGANYGANLAVIPAMMKDYYGAKNLAMNYGVVYTAWGLGGFMVSQLGSIIKDNFGSYQYAYILAAGMLILGTGLMIFLKSPQNNQVTAVSAEA